MRRRQSSPKGVGRSLAAVIATLGLLLAACGTEAEEPADGEPDPTSEEPEGEAEEATDDDGLMLGDEQIADAELWEAAQAEGSFVYYAAQPEATSQAILDLFTEETGIEAELVRLSGGRLQERILSEVAADQLGADVIQLSDLTFVEELKEEGVYAEHRVPSEAELPEGSRDEDGLYTPFYHAAMALAVNTEIVDEADRPESWADLLDPRWEDVIGIFDIGVGGSSWSVALFQRQVLGEGYWSDLASQNPSVYSGNAPLGEALTRGEIHVGTASPGFILRQSASGAPIEPIFPEEGFATFPSFLGLSSAAENPNAAKVYMNWATSLHGQSGIGQITGDYMAHTQADWPVVDGVEFPAEQPWTPERDDWIDLRDEWSTEYREVFGEAEE
jgi:iron(III) transport system substrate-binding protein